MSLVAIVIGHMGKPGRADYGAEADLDHSGKVEATEREAFLAMRYAAALGETLMDAGHNVIVQGAGSYEERTVYAHERGASVMVHCHLNASGGQEGLALHDRDSKTGPVLATYVAVDLERAVKALLPSYTCKARECHDDRKEAAKPWLYHSWSCIAGCLRRVPVGHLVEPVFIDTPAHQKLLMSPEGLEAVGKGIGSGIARFLRR